MPFDPRRAATPARVSLRAPLAQDPRRVNQDPRRVVQAFLDTLARLASRAGQREPAR